METNILGLPSLTGYTPLKAALEGQVLKYDFKGIGPIVVDKSGHGNGGKFGPNWPKNSPKRKVISWFPFEESVVFDGKDDLVFIDPSSSLDITDGITLFVRVNPEKVSGQNWIIDKRDGSDQQWSLEIYRGRIRVDWYDGADWRNRRSETRPVTTREKQELAFTWDGKKPRFYYNGEPQSSRGDSINFVSYPKSPVVLGYDQGGQGRNLCGSLGEVRIYNRALSEEEIKEI